MMRARRAWVWAAVAIGAALLGGGAAAQGLNFGSGSGGQPIEIQARDGIEWNRDAQRYIARGAARAARGNAAVDADVLTAYYRAKPSGGTEIFRIEAVGNTKISTPTEQAVADKAVYDVDSGVMVLTGKNLKLTTSSTVITARDSLEYWEKRQLMVARGDAVAISEDKRLRADILTAYFVSATAARTPGGTAPRPALPSGDAASQSQRLERVEGFGNLHVSTPTDIVRAERGVYNPQTGIATLAGSVRITRGENQLNGDFAEINLNTGISKLMSRPSEGGDNRVRGLIIPQDAQRPPEPQRAPSPTPSVAPPSRTTAPPPRPAPR